MRKLFSILLLIASINSIHAQAVDTAAPFRRFPTVPPFKLLESDSVSYFSKADLKKKKPVLLIIFSPICEHCQHETEEILKNMGAFKNVQIVMATTMPFATMREFYAKYRLADFDNIKVGLDFQYTLPSFYMIHNLPYLAMYDKKGKLISTFEGTMKIEDLIAVFK